MRTKMSQRESSQTGKNSINMDIVHIYPLINLSYWLLIYCHEVPFGQLSCPDSVLCPLLPQPLHFWYSLSNNTCHLMLSRDDMTSFLCRHQRAWDCLFPSRESRDMPQDWASMSAISDSGLVSCQLEIAQVVTLWDRKRGCLTDYIYIIMGVIVISYVCKNEISMQIPHK